MSFEQKPNTGALFKNQKEKENHPDYRGQALVNGKPMEIAAWIKKSKKGTSYMSLVFSEPFKKHTGDDTGRRSSVADLEDDAPF